MSKHKLEDLTNYLTALKAGKIGTPNKKTKK